MRFDNVYWDDRYFGIDAQFPSILAIGDSWFWYPFPGGSLLNHLGPMVKRKEHNILAIGNNGAEAFDYVFGTYEKAVRRGLKMHATSILGVFISGGGNDFAGFSDLRPLLQMNCANATSAKDCFRTDLDGSLTSLMDKISNSYTTLIGRILISAHQDVRIFIHTYSYARPTGIGVFGGSSWLKAALDDAKVPQHLQGKCLIFVLDMFADRLQKIAGVNKGSVVLVDSRMTLDSTDWANELHPTPGGFRKIATQDWEPLLISAGLA